MMVESERSPVTTEESETTWKNSPGVEINLVEKSIQYGRENVDSHRPPFVGVTD